MAQNTPPAKLDLKKQFKHLYRPPANRVTLVDVPEMQFIMIDGRLERGESPGSSPGFAQAIGALYGVAYTLKFGSKLREVDPIDYTVMALEGLWTTPAGGADYQTSQEWLWTLMIMQPEHITREMFEAALEEVAAKKPSDRLAEVRFERFHEGLSVQIMHVGPYADEPATVEKMGNFARERGYRLSGPHHEIYLGDPTKARPENLKTVLRHAVLPSGAMGPAE
ncbi:MAG: GyrI-like domain-containing protein [Anaerolineae bacterium]